MAYEDIFEFRPAGRYKPPIHAETRNAVMQRANGHCEECGEPVKLFSKLELHHLHYETEGRESPADLKAYCRACHRAAHVDPAGEFWADPQEKACYWATYENG